MAEYIMDVEDDPDFKGQRLVRSARPLTRCKNCKYGETYGTVGDIMCHNGKNGTFEYMHSGNWFCADGESKEGDSIIKPADDGEEVEKDCFTCSNSFVDENDELHCMADGHDHEKIVDDYHTCDDWN